MENILRSISFAFSQLIYPLIPDVYDIFMDLAENRYFTDEAIQRIASNLYVVVCVCMLFALAIKLISAIVNPNELDGKGADGKGTKRSVKRTFLDCVFAVLLIVIVPMGFNKMYDLQASALESHFVERIVLGMEVDENVRPGQILAAYTFVSMCEPNETVSDESLNSQGADTYNRAVTEDISLIKNMSSAINSKTNGEYDLNYHWLLSPFIGGFVFYQLVILCLDTALRGIKLGLLELITPVILCGYILKGSDILQKWFGEVLKTFILLFAKVAAISFMIYGLSLLPDFLDQFPSDTYGFWKNKLLMMFTLIALLQLIKQVPEIINGIFGTNIKFRGGIRGRLGEMAAVGDLAQKGWDAVKRTGGAALKLGAGLAASPLLAGGAALAHGWNKGFGGKVPWKDTGVGRGLRHVGAVGKGIWAGATSKKGVIGSAVEGAKAYQGTEIAQSSAGSRETDKINSLVTGLKNTFGVGKDGRLSSVVAAGSDKEKRTNAARSSVSNLNSAISSGLRQGAAGRYSEQVSKVAKASRDKELASTAKNAYDNIDKKTTALIENMTNAAAQQTLREQLGKFKTGEINAKQLLKEINKYDKGAGGDIGVDIDNLNSILMSKLSDGTTTLYGKLNTSGKAGLNISDMNDEVSALETIYNNEKSDLESAMEKDKATDMQKLAVNKTVEYVELTNQTLANTEKKCNTDKPGHKITAW